MILARQHLVVRHLEPVVVRSPTCAPPQPRLTGAFGEEVFLLESVRQRESLGTGPHQEDMVGVHQDVFGDHTGGLDALEGRDRAGPIGGSVHARGVQLHDPLFVGKPSETDRCVVRIELLYLHALDRGI